LLVHQEDRRGDVLGLALVDRVVVEGEALAADVGLDAVGVVAGVRAEFDVRVADVDVVTGDAEAVAVAVHEQAGGLVLVVAHPGQRAARVGGAHGGVRDGEPEGTVAVGVGDVSVDDAVPDRDVVGVDDQRAADVHAVEHRPRRVHLVRDVVDVEGELGQPEALGRARTGRSGMVGAGAAVGPDDRRRRAGRWRWRDRRARLRLAAGERDHHRDGPGDFREPDRSGSAGGLGAYGWYRSGGLVVSRAHRHHLSVAEPAGQVGPGARAQVAVAHLGDRQGPRYLEVRVVVADREIFGGIVLAVDAVAG